jgi:hypothetical protein
MEKTLDNTIVINVQIDKRLNDYTDKVLFPEKVARANQFIEKFGLPQSVETDLSELKQKHLAELQKTLLRFYVEEPTEEQVTQLNNVLLQLFSKKSDVKVA